MVDLRWALRQAVDNNKKPDFLMLNRVFVISIYCSDKNFQKCGEFCHEGYWAYESRQNS